MAYRSSGRFGQALTRLDTPPRSRRHHPDSTIALATQLESHQKDIPVFQAEAESSTNPALKAFARKTLPTLQEHLRRAEALSKAE
jgi:rubrerythrin